MALFMRVRRKELPRSRTMLAIRRRLGAWALMSAVVLGSTSCGNSDPKGCSLPPSISSMSPHVTNAGGPQFTLTASGDSFYVTSVLQWNGVDRQTTVVSANQVTAVIPASDIAHAGTAYVRVETPLAPDGNNVNCSGDSESLRFTINP